MIETACPSCGKRYRVREEALGRQARCQDCGQSFELRAPADPPPAANPAPAAPSAPAEAGDTKPCPYCGEEIKAVAKKCRFCGEFLDQGEEAPAAAPGAGDVPVARAVPTAAPAAQPVTGVRPSPILPHLFSDFTDFRMAIGAACSLLMLFIARLILGVYGVMDALGLLVILGCAAMFGVGIGVQKLRPVGYACAAGLGLFCFLSAFPMLPLMAIFPAPVMFMLFFGAGAATCATIWLLRGKHYKPLIIGGSVGFGVFLLFLIIWLIAASAATPEQKFMQSLEEAGKRLEKAFQNR